jgi:hypothetical protein
VNYLAHGWLYTDEPYVLAGTAAPDWLSVIDRKIRLRSRTAADFVADPDPIVAAIARGIVQHHTDDAWFHATPAFNELCLQFAVEIREMLPGDEGFRPSFLGHILVELLLDRALAEDDPKRLDNYYLALARLDAMVTQQAITRLATRPVDRIITLIPRFLSDRFLYDYLDDSKLLIRLNHIMRRVGLPQLPNTMLDIIPSQRRRVRGQMSDLLKPPPSA